MGLFSFIKNAGTKVFGGKKRAEENLREANYEKAGELKSMLNKMNMHIDELELNVDGDLVRVSGVSETQANKEKAILVLGNTAGVAQVDDNIRVITPKPEAIFHTVQKGDTLSKIAKEVYGNPMKYTSIFEANKPMLEHPDKIYPGQVLRIPEL